LINELGIAPLDWRSAQGGPDAAQAWRDALASLQIDAAAKLPR